MKYSRGELEEILCQSGCLSNQYALSLGVYSIQAGYQLEHYTNWFIVTFVYLMREWGWYMEESSFKNLNQG